MTTPFRHPTDDTLFDLVEGTIDAARMPELERHLARCAACAAFVTSARIGRERSTDAVETMPEAAVASFDAAIDAAWGERVGATTKLPAAAAIPPADDGAGDTIQLERVVPPSRPRRSPAAARPRRRFVRSAIPVFAVIVVGVLAGTSVYVDGLDSGGQVDSKSERSAPSDMEAAAPASPDAGASTEFDSDDGARQKLDEPAVAPEASAPSEPQTDGRDSAAGSASATTPEAIIGAAEPDDEVCIATNDPAQLYLPEGRIPREVIDGPLGTFVVCG